MRFSEPHTNGDWPMQDEPRFVDPPGSVPAKDLSGRADEAALTRRQLAFERMLGDLTAAFVNLPPDCVDQEIRRGLKKISELVGADHATLMEFSPDGSQLRRVHGYGRPGVESAPGIIASRESPWYAAQLRQGVTLVLRRLPDDLPAEAVPARRFCLEHGLKSSLTIPLLVRGEIVSAIAFASFTQFGQWPDELISRLRLLGTVFANALAYRQAHEALRDSEQRFRRMAGSWQSTFDAVRDVVTILNRDMQILQVNAGAAQFYGLPVDRIVGQRCHVLTHGTDHPVEGCPFARARQTRQRAEAELYDAPRDRWLQVSIDPVLEGEDISHFVHTIRDITERKRSHLALEQAYREIEQLKNRLEQENLYLRGQVQPAAIPGALVGQSPALLKVLRQVEQVANTNASVLITGETGTGKELIAAAIHELSGRRERMMVRVNCAALPPTLIESELFGREKGAYTGALTRQVGRFELAHGSTIFLDEVGELLLELQSKLLRVLQEGRFERLGSPKTIQVDVRVIAASNRDLAHAIRAGQFREDLFYRLNVFPIHVPPLRERPEDIPVLVETFVEEFSKAAGKTIESVPRSVIESLQRYRWPGNVRELRNVVERAVIVSPGPSLLVEPPASAAGHRPSARTLEEAEREHILGVLEQTSWRIRGRGFAAEILGLKPTTLEARMAKLGLQRSRRDVDQRGRG
jgi:PAS domain S-box-containing protein